MKLFKYGKCKNELDGRDMCKLRLMDEKEDEKWKMEYEVGPGCCLGFVSVGWRGPMAECGYLLSSSFWRIMHAASFPVFY